MAQSASDKSLLKTARLRFKQATDVDQQQRDREKVALGFYAGDQWPTDILNTRQGLALNQVPPSTPVPARPTVTINLVKEPVRQVLNQERQADLGIELIPADDFGTLAEPINQEEIDLREGIIRRIQRDSEANDARSWAFSRAVIAGRGYYGVMTRYAPGKTSDQEIYLERFYDQNSVRLDPSHEQPDGSDANWGFTGTDTMPWEEYKAQYPKLADGSTNPLPAWSKGDFDLLDDDEKEWFTFSEEGRPSHVRMVNYYFASWTGKELAMFPDGRAEWKKDLSPDIPEASYTCRRVTERTIEWIKTDGVHVLDRTDWPGHYIPIIKVIGEELQPYDTERRAEGIVAPAIEPGRAANYMISKFVETVGLSPIPQWIMAAGQDEGFEEEWNGINTRTLGRLHYNLKDSEGVPAGPPQRVSTQSDVAAVAGGVQMFMEFVQKVMSSPDPALGHVDPSIKSGKLGKLLIDRALMGNSNYMDNLARSMRHEARVINDLLYPIYGQRPGRLMRLMNGNKEHESVILGRPMVMQNGKPQPARQGQPNAKTYTLTPDVEFSVAVKIGKNYDTRRQEEADTLGQLIAAEPNLMAVVGDLFFANQDWPGAKEMAERMKAMLAPPVQALVNPQQGQQAQAQQQLVQMQQQMAELQQLADKNKADLAKTQMQEQAETQRADKADQAGILKAEIAAQASMANAQAKVDAENFRSYVDAMESRLAKQLDLHLAKVSQVMSQTHEAATQGREHAHALVLAEHQAQQAAADREMAAMTSQSDTGA